MKDEKFSAFIDNELHDSDFNEMYETLHSDSEMKHRWQRYHIISDTIQKHLPSKVDCSLADRVMRQLDKEPTIIAPEVAPEITASQTNRNTTNTHDQSPATSSNTATTASPFFSTFSRQIAGFAVAASVMVVAVFATQSFTDTPDSMNVPVAKVQSIPKTMPDKSQFARVTEPNNKLPPGIQNQLNKYLANHNQYSTNTAPGVLPYARILGYRQGTKPVIKHIQNKQ